MKIVVNNVTIDGEVDYYSLLGVNRDASNSDIIFKGSQLLSFLGSENTEISMSDKERYDNCQRVMEAVNILSNSETRKAYDDLLKLENDNVKKKNEIIKVDNVDVADEKTIKAAKSKIDLPTVAAVAGIILLTAATGLAAYDIISTNSRIKSLQNKNNNISNSIDKDNSIANSNEQENEQVVNDESTSVTQISEEASVDVSLDVNSEQVIQNTVDKIYAEVSKSSDANIKDMIDRETVEALVRYTRDNSILSGEYAYELFKTLYLGKIDLSMFFENLDSYSYLSRLNNATSKIVEDNGSYDDEYEAFLAIGEALDSMNSNNYAEVWAVSVESDYSTYYASMNIARGGAKENGEEGQEYIDEKNKVHSNVRQECSDIYNKVRTDDQNSLLMQYRMNAINNENMRTRG